MQTAFSTFMLRREPPVYLFLGKAEGWQKMKLPRAAFAT
jgi:hypothetical protein